MSFYRIPISGSTDANGSAAIQIGPLQGYQFFLGFVSVQVAGSGTGLFELQDLSGAPIGSAIGRPAVIGPLYLAPGEQAILAVSAALANSSVRGYLSGDRNADPAQLASPIPPTSAAIPPATWSQFSSPGTGVMASTTLAGIPGIRHILTRFAFSFSAGTAIAASGIDITLRDGPSGSGTAVDQYGYTLPAAVIPPFSFGLSGSALFTGTPGRDLTFEFSAGLANLTETLSISGYDQ